MQHSPSSQGRSGHREPTPEQFRAWRRRSGPPANEIPGTAALSLLLARTDDLAVALIGLRAYSTGLLFDLTVRLRTPDRPDRQGGPLHQALAGPLRGEHVFLLGFEYPDGRTATNLRWGFRPPFDAVDEPQLLPSGGGGGSDQTFDAGYFLSPRPTGGDLTVVCAWPSRGIPETQAVIAGELIGDAASRITELWPWVDLPDEPPEPPAPRLPDLPPGSWFAATLAR